MGLVVFDVDDAEIERLKAEQVVIKTAERLQQVWDGSRVGLTVAIHNVAEAVRALKEKA